MLVFGLLKMFTLTPTYQNRIRRIAILVDMLMLLILFVIVCVLINKSNGICTSVPQQKEGMSPSQRVYLAQKFSQVPAEKYTRHEQSRPTPLDNATVNMKRKLKRNTFNLYPNPERAGNPTNVARGGMPSLSHTGVKITKNGNMAALNGAKMNGYTNNTSPTAGNSDIVSYENTNRMSGPNMNVNGIMNTN